MTPQDRYRAKNIKSVKFELNIKTDADILAYLATIENKQGYLKELIRKDMKRGD